LTNQKFPGIDADKLVKDNLKNNWYNKTNAPSIDFENMSYSK
jgi:hypothetical protein